jgi:very-long-chain (3R)-3-hydroxyacyl-CoA dehydratase
MDAQDRAATARRPLKPLQSRRGKTQYLIMYNAASALLWLIVLGRVAGLNALAGPAAVFGATGEFVKWTQTLAGLEVVHAACGT